MLSIYNISNINDACEIDACVNGVIIASTLLLLMDYMLCFCSIGAANKQTTANQTVLIAYHTAADNWCK